jgi:hypothetical protein
MTSHSFFAPTALLAAAFILAACSDDSGTSAVDGAAADAPSVLDGDAPALEVRVEAVADGIAEGGTDGTAGVVADGTAEDGTDGMSCAVPRVWRYERAGCGDQAPAPVCGTSVMDACAGAPLCACDGTVLEACEPWGTKPWAYRFSGLFTEAARPTTCDPNMPPVVDGGTN